MTFHDFSLVASCWLFPGLYYAMRTKERHDIEIAKERADALRHIPNDEQGRLGTTFDGQTQMYRNLDTGEVFSQLATIYLDPMREQINAMHKLLQVSNGHIPDSITEQIGAQGVPQLPLPTYVSLNTLMKKYSFSPRYDKIALGETVNPTTNRYELVTGDMADFVHVIVSGRTGFGKSIELEAMAKQLVLAGDCDVAFVDYGVNTFGMMTEHAAYKIADTPNMAIALFRILVQEMHSRREKMAEYPQVKKLSQYNQLTGDDLRPIVVFCDEAPALFGKSSEIRNLVRDMTGMGRKFEVGCVFGGTDFKVDIMPSETRGNCGLRMAMRLEEPGLSRSIIRSTQAVNLNDKGRALALLPGVPGLVEMQCPIVARWEDLPPKREQIALNCAKFVTPKTSHLPDYQTADIMARWRNGEKVTPIAREIFGYVNSDVVCKVRDVIEQHDNDDDDAGDNDGANDGL